MPSNAECPRQLRSKHTRPTAQLECMRASLVKGYGTSAHQKQLNALMPGTSDEWCSTGNMYKLVDMMTGKVVNAR